MSSGIDFVITWVDGSDPEWLAEKEKYNPKFGADAREIRYRDWGLLKYWFRGVEEYASWVNHIYFVTYGHVPKWLNLDNPKLTVVKHEDFIDKKYLPTFNCNPLELNFHRIKGLSEKFVYFNDDMFILNKVAPEDFFQGDLPKDIAVLGGPAGEDYTYFSIIENDLKLIGKYYKTSDIKMHFKKFVSPKIGLYNLRTLFSLPWHRIIGFYERHHATPLLKSTYETLWQKEPELLKEVTSHRFRTDSDLNQYIFKYWQFCEGTFVQSRINKIAVRPLDEKCNLNNINLNKYPLVCLNDSDNDVGEERYSTVRNEVRVYLNSILPDKSSFEE